MAHPVLFLLTPPSHFVKSASNIPADIKKVEYLFDILNDYDHINAFSFIFNNKLCSLGQALQSHGSNGTEYAIQCGGFILKQDLAILAILL